MSLGTDLSMAGRNLLRHTRRTIFLGMALASVTALLVLLLGLTTGIKATMLRSATTLSSGHLNVGGFFKVTAGQSAPLVSNYAKVMQVVKKSIPDMDYMVQRGRGWARVISAPLFRSQHQGNARRRTTARDWPNSPICPTSPSRFSIPARPTANPNRPGFVLHPRH